MSKVDATDIVSAEANPRKKVHRPVFVSRGRGRTWYGKRKSGRRTLKLNPKLPSSAQYEHLPKLTFGSISSGIVGFFATGGTGAGIMLGTDIVAKAAKFEANPAYEPVRDIVRLLGEGILGLKIYPMLAHKITKNADMGKAAWVGGTILVGLDLGITAVSYGLKGIAMAMNKTAPESPKPAEEGPAGMAFMGLSGLGALLKGGAQTAAPAEAAHGAEIAELQSEMDRYSELSALYKGLGETAQVGGADKSWGTLTK